MTAGSLGYGFFLFLDSFGVVQIGNGDHSAWLGGCDWIIACFVYGGKESRTYTYFRESIFTYEMFVIL